MTPTRRSRAMRSIEPGISRFQVQPRGLPRDDGPLRGPSVQLLDRDRDALPDADAHGGERELAAALLQAVHRGHGEPRAAHAEGMAERNRAAMRVDEVGIVLDAELAQAGDAL